MEKQLMQLVENVKTYCKRLGILILAAAFGCASLITVCGENTKKVSPFKAMELSECANENVEYAFGDVERESFAAIQNRLNVAAALDKASEVEPEIVDVKEKETEMVASANVAPSASPVHADPSSNGYEFLGTFTTTGYCACAKCCGKTNGITASGAVATANHTIAADTRVLPFGTQVVIDGTVYTVEDRGGAIKGGRIDIFFASHQDALNYGRRSVNVYRYVGVSENESTIVMEPAVETPSTEAPAAVAPSTAAPATVVPSTEAPATVAPSTEAPATEAPSTEAPAES